MAGLVVLSSTTPFDSASVACESYAGAKLISFSLLITTQTCFVLYSLVPGAWLGAAPQELRRSAECSKTFHVGTVIVRPYLFLILSPQIKTLKNEEPVSPWPSEIVPMMPRA